MKYILKEIFVLFFCFLRADCLFRYLNRKKILILVYHGVIDKTLDYFCEWQLPLDQFEWQMKYLKQHYTILPLELVINKIKKKESLPHRTAVITFDDGYHNNYTRAYPVLIKEKIPATIFLTTGYISTKNILWHDDIYLAFKHTKKSELSLLDVGIGFFKLDTLSSKKKSCFAVMEHLKNISADKKFILINRIKHDLRVGSLPFSDQDNFLLLSEQEIDEMYTSGYINFGAHTSNHEILTRLDEKAMQSEIVSSCEMVKKKLNMESVAFAYPNGKTEDFNEEIKNCLKGQNVSLGLTMKKGLNDHDEDLFELKRTGIECDITKNRFKWRISGFRDWLVTIRNIWHQATSGWK